MPFSSIDQVTSGHLQPQECSLIRDDPSRWSSSQLSELRQREVNIDKAAERVDVAVSRPESNHRRLHRANSFSTISEDQSVSGAGKRGELRIVIDRSEDRPKTADEHLAQTALDFPIPHHRLGSPRFNTERSAALQSSVHTRTSMSDNFRNSTLLGSRVDTVPTHLQSPYGRESFSRNRLSFAVSLFSGTAAIDLSRASPAPRNSMVYELKGPVEPSIYEALVSDMDGETVVRYIPGTKDISAATPARIVAQISSESFMDYELVSDFFLTFRSYLSPDHLLALLLARLQWAINRLQEDGRIIRIRTFAALRHWILNYFVDDFVPNYDLRAHFCETINSLYQEVRCRENGGMSDLKILLDLKRCWNGKCSMYWNTSDCACTYNDPDTPISPGSAQIKLSTGNQTQQNPPLIGVSSAPEGNFYDSLPPPTQHDRNDSAATDKSIPFSTKSDQSMLALSCSLPPKSPKRLSMPYLTGKGPRPVPLSRTKMTTSSQEGPPSSPMFSRYPFPGHGHKRSGSFSDSVRDDRVPMFVMESGLARPPVQEILDPVGLIRGVLYPPAESYMTAMAPDSPPLHPPSTPSNPDRRSTQDGGPKNNQLNSGVRTIIGSIRRALHSRNGAQSVSARIANAPEGITMPSRHKTSAMPNNITLGSEFYRERKLATLPKRPARFDVLCDEALKQYRLVVNAQAAGDDVHAQPIAPGVLSTPDASSPNPNSSASLQAPQAESSKIRSGLTTGSGSIVIVDDTGFEFPTTSGGDLEPMPNTVKHDAALNSDSNVAAAPMSHESTASNGEYLLPIYFNGNPSETVPQQSSLLHPPSFLSQRRSFSNERRSTTHKLASISLRLRKYASFQSGISRHRLSMGTEGGKSIASSDISQGPLDKPPGPALRRRPGGNLRQMQFVGGNDSSPNRRSFASTPSYDSFAETSMTNDDTVSRPPTTLIPPNPRFSLVQRSSNRKLRRSFEAAIAQFAQIPDDDDGGIESTLLKLEGKWPTSPTHPEARQPDHLRVTGESNNRDENPAGIVPEILKADSGGWNIISRRRQTDRSTYSTVGGRLAPPRPYSDSVAESEESYNSIPLLERGLADESMKRPPISRAPLADTHEASISLVSSRDTSELVSSHPSIQIVQETDSIRGIPRGSTNPEPAYQQAGQITPKHSAVLSSDAPADLLDSHDTMSGRMSVDTRSLSSSTVEIPSHPLAHPPSPPMTIQNANSFTSCASPLEKVFFQAQPLTPDTSPRRREVDTATLHTRNVPQFSSDVLSNSEKERHDQVPFQTYGPDHVPFVLACDSQMLAQQLTLVEMAALSEVDWRDLVEMKWSNNSQCVLNWIQFLTAEERKGIDLVVGRFNLMVKWVVSEIILTQDINERARTVIKFIHTAAHARRLCNYATMLQIAIALSSSDCSRLQGTWQLVPLEDKRLFKDMECLIQPIRNFHDLRVEMETANLQEGCIPFIGKCFPS